MTADTCLTQTEFKLFQDLMYNHAGIRLSDRKHALVQSRLKKRLHALGMKSYHSYYQYLHAPEHVEEFQECLNALTTNETFFFRHKNHWDHLINFILPAWKASVGRGGVFKAWSAASSSGEEPYSLAIAIRDALPADEGFKVSVDATDINQDVINRAKVGEYGQYAIQKLTPLCIKRYFHAYPEEERYVVREEIRRLVHYKLHNLQLPTTGPGYDLIFLRNVMIYFDDNSKATVMQNVTKRLKSGGHLFLGGAETISAYHDQYEYVRPTIYRKR